MEEHEEKDMIKQLKELCYLNGKEKHPRKSAKILYKLGTLYRKKTPDRMNLLQSIALMTSALIREPDNSEEIKESLDEVCSHVFQLAGVKKPPDFLDDIVSNLKQQVSLFRREVVEKLSAVTKIPQTTENDAAVDELESKKIKEITDLQIFGTEKYTKLMTCICKHCVDIMGNPPCKYALVGLGSLARKEVTPYSDFESIIVLEEGIQQTDDYPHVLEYFRWLATIFQMILIRLGETVLRFMAIPCLNDPLNPENNWFYDAYTPCGIRPDGFAPAACKNPLGRQTFTPRKPWATELIKPVSEMVKYLDSEEDLKNGYHLADILMKTCFVAGNREIYENFEKSSLNKRTLQQLNEKDLTLQQISNQLLEDFDWYDKLTVDERRKSSFDMKRTFYRGSTLFVSALGSLYGLKESSCQDILDKLLTMIVITAGDCHKLKLSVAVACEFRLRVYSCFNGQRDHVSKSIHVGQRLDGLSDVIQSIGTRAAVSGISGALLLMERLWSIEHVVPETFVLPIETHLIRAQICCKLSLSDEGLSECSKHLQARDDKIKIEAFLTYTACLHGTDQQDKLVLVMKNVLSTNWNLISVGWLFVAYRQISSSLLIRHQLKSALKFYRIMNYLVHCQKYYPGDFEVKKLFYNIGICYIRMERFRKALKYINRGLRNLVQPVDVFKSQIDHDLLFRKSICFHALGRQNEADDLMKQLIDGRRMVAGKDDYDYWINSCEYQHARSLVELGNYQKALDLCETTWGTEGNKPTFKVIYLFVKSQCLFALCRDHDAYSCFQELKCCIEDERRQGRFHFNLDPHRATVDCLVGLAKCASDLGRYKEAVNHCTRALDEYKQKWWKSASDTRTMHDTLYLLALYREKRANSEELDEQCATKTSQNQFFTNIQSLFALGYRNFAQKDYAMAINHFQKAFDVLPKVPENIASRRRRTIANKVLKQNTHEFATDRYRIAMGIALDQLDRNREAFFQHRQAWREASTLEWSKYGMLRKLWAICHFLRALFFKTKTRERLRAADCAVTLALEIDKIGMTSVVFEVLRAYLVCYLECSSQYHTVAYSYTPSIYYRAMRAITALKNVPDICNKKWSEIRTIYLQKQLNHRHWCCDMFLSSVQHNNIYLLRK